MAGAPRVSIITPAYRAEAFLARAARSVLAQTRPDWEMIIVADDEVDYEAVLRDEGIRDPRLRFVATGGTGMGLSYARNIGLDRAGDLIALLDADDAFHPPKLERLVPHALEHGLCTCALDYLRMENGARHLIRRIGAGVPDGLLTPDTYLDVHFSANSIMVFDRRRLPIRWREDLPVLEDLVFAMSAFDHLPAVHHCEEALYDYIYTENSLSTAPGAPARFLGAKRRILDLLEQGTLGINRPESVAALRRFLHHSMEAEREYAEALARGDSITFSELLEKRLARSRLRWSGLPSQGA